jgi:hypothetical protein
MYARAASADTSRDGRTNAGRELSDITGINGRAQDLRDGYTLTRELYEKAWARENKPYWEGNVLTRFDKSAQLWIERMDRVTRARHEWSRTRKLPPPDSIGIRAPKTASTVSSRR